MKCNNDHNYWSMVQLMTATLVVVLAFATAANASSGEVPNYAPLTACQHLRQAETRRAKSLDVDTSARSPRSVQVRIPKCSRSGDFEPIQCSNEINGTECWCVDEFGVEIAGTRREDEHQMECPANGESPECPASSCRMYCPAGFAKDPRSGCPKCQCRDPCEGVECPGDLSCQLQEVTCLSDPCPPIPTCKKARSLNDLCPAGQPLTIQDTPRPFLCGHEPGKPMCPPTYKCLVQNGNDYGVCCPATVAFEKPGTCPRADDVQISPSAGVLCGTPCSADLECPQMDKCCPSNGCGANCRQPFNVTTCHQARMMSEMLSVNEREGRGYIPECDSRSGVFARRQCSRNGLVCWCVDPHSGNKIRDSMGAASTVRCDRMAMGGKSSSGRSQSRSVDSAQKCDKNICASVCEYGFKIDHDGCATCECSEPCEGFQCPSGAHCEVARDLECSSASALCASEPVCKPDLAYTNPCEAGTPMASNKTGEVFYCQKDEMNSMEFQAQAFFDANSAESSRAMSNLIACPADYQCTKLYGVPESVCCPKPDTVETTESGQRPQSMCEYLRDFSDRMEGTEAGMVLALPTPGCHKDGTYEPRICTTKTIKITRAQRKQMLEQQTVRQMRALLASAPQNRSLEQHRSRRSDDCPELNCNPECEYGYKRDDRGYFVCDCQEKCHSTDVCPLPCEEWNGYETQANGCRSCKCAALEYVKPKECPYLPKCKPCELGYVFDERGCNTCQCQKVKYPSHNCPKLNCGRDGEVNFQQRDKHGCMTCTESKKGIFVQIQDRCDPKRCYPCPNGYKISRQDGCETCECLDSPRLMPKPAVVCPDTECGIRCQFGLKYDHNGCALCECQETEYPTAGCPTMSCAPCDDSGYKRDQHGCLTCSCINGNTERTKREAPSSGENLRLTKVSSESPSGEQLDVKSLLRYLRQNTKSDSREANYMAEILSRKLLSQVQVQERSAKVIDNQDFANSAQSLDRGSGKVSPRPKPVERYTVPTPVSALVEVEIEECFCVDGFGTEIPSSRGTNVTMGSCVELRESLECLDITCRMGCDYGFVLDPETRCPTCECRDPCDSVTCPDNQECRSVEVSCEGEYCPPVPACLPRKPGQCPFLVPPGTEGSTIDSCEYECRSDQHCADSKRCCSNGCGTQCVEPQLKTACQHLQTIQLHQATELGIPPKQKYIAQCNETDGAWQRVQCGPDQVCWCVDATGNELSGTRTLRGTPNCDHVRNECEVRKCGPCEFGYVVTDDGCRTCQCRNPCDEIKCPGGEQCQLMRVECIDEPCPRMPVCVPQRESVCSEGSPFKRNGQDLVCGPQGDADVCPSTHTCQLDVESRKGVCCAKTRDVCFESVDNGCLAQSTSENITEALTTWRFSPKQNRCVQMLSEKSCQSKNLFHSETACQSVCPVLSQCERLRLRNSLAAKRVQQSAAWFQPRCDPDTGSWSPVQCLGRSTPTPSPSSDLSNGVSRAFSVSEPTPINPQQATMGVCWCADKKGAPVKGSLTRGVEPMCNHRQARRRMSHDSDAIRDPMIEQLISQITLIAEEDNLIESEFAEPALGRSNEKYQIGPDAVTEKIIEIMSHPLIAASERESTSMLMSSSTRCHALKKTASFQVACKPDGTFEPTQCNEAVCWCVDAAGNQLPDSQTFSIGSTKCIFTPIDAVSVELHFQNPKQITFKNLYDILRAELKQLLGEIPDNLRVHENADGNIYLKFDLTNERKIDTAFALEEMAKQEALVLARGELMPDITLSRFVHRTSTYPAPQPAVLMPESTFQMIVFVLATSSAFLVSIFVVFVMLKRGKNKMKSYNTNKTVGMGDKFLDYSSPIFVLSAADKATAPSDDHPHHTIVTPPLQQS